MKSEVTRTFSRGCSGFSLLEMLICVVAVAVLLSLALPALHSVRNSQRQTRCLANLQGCSTAVLSYTGEYRETFPYLATSATMDDAFRLGSFSLPFDMQSAHWPTPVSKSWNEALLGFPQLCPYSSALQPSDPPEVPLASYPDRYGFAKSSEYWLSYALFTSTSLWSRGARDVVASDLEPCRMSAVQYPSLKGLLVEVIPWHAVRLNPHIWRYSIFRADRKGTCLFSCVDGSAGVAQLANLAEPSDQTPSNWSPAPLLCTPGGAAGRDVVTR